MRVHELHAISCQRNPSKRFDTHPARCLDFSRTGSPASKTPASETSALKPQIMAQRESVNVCQIPNAHSRMLGFGMSQARQAAALISTYCQVSGVSLIVNFGERCEPDRTPWSRCLPGCLAGQSLCPKQLRRSDRWACLGQCKEHKRSAQQSNTLRMHPVDSFKPHDHRKIEVDTVAISPRSLQCGKPRTQADRHRSAIHPYRDAPPCWLHAGMRRRTAKVDGLESLKPRATLPSKG